jgi:hypothetical protein
MSMQIMLALATAFTGGATSAAGAFLLWYRWLRVHEHQWEVTGAAPHAVAGRLAPYCTVVLWRCRSCPEVRTTELEGHWLTGQLVRRTGTTVADATVEFPVIAGVAS